MHCVHVYFIHAKFIWEDGLSAGKMPLPDWPVGKPVLHFLDSLSMWEETAPCGSCHAWDGGPGCCKKAA